MSGRDDVTPLSFSVLPESEQHAQGRHARPTYKPRAMSGGPILFGRHHFGLAPNKILLQSSYPKNLSFVEVEVLKIEEYEAFVERMREQTGAQFVVARNVSESQSTEIPMEDGQ